MSPKTRRAQTSSPKRKGAKAGAGRSPRWVAWGLVVAFGLALLFQLQRSADLIGADQRLRAVEQASIQMVSTGRVSPQQVAAHLQLLRDAQEMDPSSVAIPMIAGSQSLVLGNPQGAADRYRESLELEPRPETYLNLGRALLALGDRAGAREAFGRAVSLAPRLASQVPAAERPQRRRRGQQGDR